MTTQFPKEKPNITQFQANNLPMRPRLSIMEDMPQAEIEHLDILARVDELIERLSRWVEIESTWEPFHHTQAVIKRLLSRLDVLRVRLEAPLVVATFGGTGTGKSALVNALVGFDCTESGRQRPTTTRPVLVVHPQTELESLGLPLDDFQIVRCDAPLLRDVVVIDCPDPDTTESETQGSNLARLHQLLPFCDVLIYTSTQQKYRSARVGEELLQAATGCRLVFVQTFADIDEDIRDDWRQQLAGHYAVPNLFFVDSLRALREEQSGLRTTGDFRRLTELLSTQLTASHRAQIRRANLVDLVQGALDHCRDHLSAHWPAVNHVETVLEDQLHNLTARMSDKLRDELLTSRNLWERRLLGAVTQHWGFSPFASILRVYHGLGSWLASAGLLRARTSAQVALIGAAQGVRWLTSKQQELNSESRLDRVAALGLDDTLLRETQLVVAGYVQEAKLDARLIEGGDFDNLRHEAARVEDRFLGNAGERVDAIIADVARRHSGPLVRWSYELLLAPLLAYLISWPAYNFFYLFPVKNQELIPVEFYIHGAIFLGIWSALLVMFFTRGLRRGLNDRIAELATQLAQNRLATGLFPQLERACHEIRLDREQLESLAQTTASLRRHIAGTSALGATLSPAKISVSVP